MAGNEWNWEEMAGMAGNNWKLLKRMEMSGFG